MPPPDGVEKGAGQGWHPDPYGRYEQPVWSGYYWTEAVASEGQTLIDLPRSG